MPLPGFLSGTYKRYKSDTDCFASWLAETAEACAKANGLPMPTRDGNSKYKIALHDFTRFSEIIAKYGAQIEIPPKIVGFARRAILLRRRFADRFKAKIHESHGDKGHIHFIRILEGALKILGVPEESSIKPTGQPSTFARTVDGETPSETANRFSTLDLEEPDEFEDDRKSKKAKTDHIPPVHEVKYEFEDEFDDDLEPAMLACFCLLDDLGNIRDFLIQTWSDYQDGKVDLMSASVTTDTALALARQAIEQAEKVPDFPAGPGKFHTIVYTTMCIARGKNPYTPQKAGVPFDMAMFDAAELCYLVTYILLNSFCNVVKPGQTPRYKKGHFGIYDPSQDRSKMSGSEKFTEDKIVLLQAMPDFAFLSQFKIPIPGEDAFTKGVKEMVKTKNVSLWLSFAAQVYLDIHHTLRANVGQGFQELRLTGLRAKKVLKDHFTFSTTLSCPNWSMENDLNLKDIQDTVERFIEHDVFFLTKSESAPLAKEDEFSFLRWHPMQAGLLMFNINLRMQYIGTALVNAWGSVILLAYLYNTVQNEGMVSLDWPDMDKIVEYHGEERIFFGGKPKDLQDAYKKICLVLGCAPETFTAGRVVVSKNGPRGLEESTTVSKLFLRCYTQGGSLDFSVANVSRLLNDLTQSESSKQPQSGQHASGLLKRKWQTTQTLSPLQLLAALRERLVDEEPRLIFNYFGMHKRGIELMRLLRTALNDKLTQYFGPNYIEGEYQLPALVLYIYHVAVQSGKASRQMGLAPPGGKTSSILMQRAGKIMQDFLRSNGSVACKELRAFCKNEKHTKEEAVKEGNRREEDAQFWFTLEEIIDPRTMAALQTGIGL